MDITKLAKVFPSLSFTVFLLSNYPTEKNSLSDYGLVTFDCTYAQLLGSGEPASSQH